jgi:CubicO group peptidase (beta-lactamase class C family)
MTAPPARRRGRLLWTVSLAALVLLAAGLVAPRVNRAARVGAGLAAHLACSMRFVGGQGPAASAETLQVMAGPLSHLLGSRLDEEAHAAEGSFLGLRLARAQFTQGYGCRLEYPGQAPAPAPRAAAAPVAADDFAPATGMVTATSPEIARALAGVFAEHPGDAPKHVKAVVVVLQDQVIAERYAPGIAADTPLLSWSVAKSFTNALAGILVREGRLITTRPLAPREWQQPGDPRAHITVEDLMRMQSGLAALESGSPSDPVARMEFMHADMAGFAASLPLRIAPGEQFEYTSANTLLLARRLGEIIGGGPAGLRDFAERELFAPLHMQGVTLEFDGAGTYVGASFAWAPARSYARFGTLFLHDGVTREGRRILPPGWVEWSRHSALGAPYGAGFWTNDGDSHFARLRAQAGFPQDGFFASGVLGQRIYIVPSAQVVVARFGASAPPDYGIEDDLPLIAAAVRMAALPSKSSE